MIPRGLPRFFCFHFTIDRCFVAKFSPQEVTRTTIEKKWFHNLFIDKQKKIMRMYLHIMLKNLENWQQNGWIMKMKNYLWRISAKRNQLQMYFFKSCLKWRTGLLSMNGVVVMKQKIYEIRLPIWCFQSTCIFA